jgi:uncharacterized protein YjbI with pentapeptide repeats
LNADDFLDLVRHDINAWNAWKFHSLDPTPGEREAWPDLSGADMHGFELEGVDLSGLNLTGANLSDAILNYADLKFSNLCHANLERAAMEGADLEDASLQFANCQGAAMVCANLWRTDFTASDLTDADFEWSNLAQARFRGARLHRTNLSRSILVDADFSGAKLIGCRVFGTSAWNLNLEGTQQTDLILTRESESPVTVDNIEVAQLIYLFLDNKKIGQIVDGLSSRLVLILGRFGEHHSFLEGVRQALRGNGFSPVLFDFDGPEKGDSTEFVQLLASLSCFVLCDLTNPRSVPHELASIVPSVTTPVVPVIQNLESPYGMFQDLLKYPWVCPLRAYQDETDLASYLRDEVPAIVSNARIRSSLS